MLSVVIITCDEGHHLPACVKSVRSIADEIVVCDMMSTDGCVDLAKELGCRVIEHARMPAPDPEARTAVIEAAAGDWILAFDPDMRLPAATASWIQQVVANDEVDIVDFYCEQFYFGRRCLHGHGSQPVYRKLFRKSCFQPVSRNIHTFFQDSLHGRVVTSGRDTPLQHLAYESVSRCLDIHTRYALREAEQAVAGGRRPSLARMLFSPVRRFAGNYLLRQGFRDGMPGFLVSTIVAWYAFLIEAHVWDLTRQKHETPEDVEA